MRKVLISSGYGAGWSTWANQGREEFYLFDAPLIAAIERDGVVTPEALADFERREIAEFGDAGYHGGARNLQVVEVEGPFRVNEYDGFESVEYRDQGTWF
jgi:hypothetical protein